MYKAGKINETQYKTAVAAQQRLLIKATSTPPTPEGYELYSAKTIVRPPLPDNPATQEKVWTPETPVQKVTEYTYVPETFQVEANTGLFGPQTTREATPEEAAILKKQAAEGTLVTRTMEEKAALGLSATLTGAMVVTSIPAAVGAGALLGGGETVKVGVTGKHLTVEEGVFLAGVGAISGSLAPKVASYAKSGIDRLVGRLSPERAMYNRVVLSQQTEAVAQQQSSLSLSEKIRGVFSPKEAEAFKHLQPLGENVKTPTSVPSSSSGLPKGFTTGGGGGTQLWVQQTLVKQTTQQKATTYAMKPLLPTLDTASLKALTLTRTTPVTSKAVTKTVTQQKSAVKTASLVVPTLVGRQRVKNPFTQFPGKSYYKQRRREEEELVVISVPKGTPLATPKEIQSVVQTPKGITAIKDITTQKIVPSQTPSLVPTTVTNQKQEVNTQQIQRQIQEVVTSTKTITRTPKLPKEFGFPLGGGDVGTPSFSRFSGAWFKRKHKVKTAKQMLKTFGFSGKTPKSIKRISRMEVPGFGVKRVRQSAKRSSKKRKRRTRHKRK